MPVCVKPHSCRSCHKRFADEERLTNHQSRAHGSEEFKTIQCNICSKRFLNNSALGSHLRTHNDQGSLWECSICKETYGNRDGLKGHVASHSSNGSFPCPYCQKEFSGYLSIRKHIIKTHKSSGVQCSLCDRFCSSAQKYEEHMLRHANQVQLLCVHCGKQFKRNDKLKEHVKRMHRLQECDPIEAEAKQQEEKKLEKRREEKLRDLNAQYLFKCKPCLLGFKRRGMLVNHIAKYHPTMNPDEVPELSLPIMQTTRDFYCHLCEKVYKSNAKRKAHILKFHPGASKGEQLKNTSFDQPAGTVARKPEHCPWCHKQYATNAKLLQHMRSQHPDKACNIAELRKRGKSRIERDSNDSVKSDFYEKQVSKIIETISNESIGEELNVDSCSSEMLIVEAIADELSSHEICVEDTLETEVCSPEMFVVEMKDDGIDSPETPSVAEVEVGTQLEPLMTDDDLTLAVCLLMSHASMTNVEVAAEELVGSPQCDSVKVEMSAEDLMDAEKEICEVRALGGTTLTPEDVDLLMAEWLVDLQAGPPPPLPPNAVPVIQRAFSSGLQSEVGENLTDLCAMSVMDDSHYSATGCHLYDLSALSTTQLPPPQVVYSPYPPH